MAFPLWLDSLWLMGTGLPQMEQERINVVLFDMAAHP
jgi:hypothetical protein